MAPFAKSSSTKLMAVKPKNPFAPKPKAPAAPKAGSKSKAAPAKAKKDMTWGGRPDPAPEAIIVAGGFLNAPWRLNQKGPSVLER